MKFKVGDRVKRVRGGRNSGMEEGDTGVIVSIETDNIGDNYFDIKTDATGYISVGNDIKNIELVTKTTLKELPNTVVHVETQEEYDELMQIYEDAGWQNKKGVFSKSYSGKTGDDSCCVRASNGFWHCKKKYYEKLGCKFISFQEFKEIQGLVQKPENYDELLTTCTSTTSYGYLTEGALEDAITDVYRYAYIPFPTYPQWYGCDFGSQKVTTKKKGIMSYLKDIPNRIKKLLSKDLAAMYKLGWIDEELNLTSAGKDQLNIILQDEYEVKLGAVAQKQVTKLEKECKK